VASTCGADASGCEIGNKQLNSVRVDDASRAHLLVGLLSLVASSSCEASTRRWWVVIIIAASDTEIAFGPIPVFVFTTRDVAVKAVRAVRVGQVEGSTRVERLSHVEWRSHIQWRSHVEWSVQVWG
jgi:hypothetical protein